MNKKLLLTVTIISEILVILLLINNVLNFKFSGLYFFELQKSQTDAFQTYLGDYITPTNSSLLWSLKPNFIENFTGIWKNLSPIPLVINSDGFRDREFDLQKPNNTIRIIALGDSFTFGWAVSTNDSYPKILESQLNEQSKGKTYQVLNFGVPSYNTAQEVELLKEKGLKYKPDIVILQFLFNDVENNTRLLELMRQNKYDLEQNGQFNDSLATREKVFDISVQELNFEESKYPSNYTWYENVFVNLKELKSLSEEYNFKVVIVDTTSYQWKSYLYSTAEEFNFPIVAADMISQNTSLKLPDGHPNNLGQEYIANQIFTLLNKTDDV